MYQFDELPNRKLDKSRKWDETLLKSRFPNLPEDYIPMWIADMDYVLAPEILDALRSILEIGTLGYTYTYDAFYDAVIDWQKRRHQVDVTKEAITLVYGTVSTIHYLLQCFCTTSQKVLMNTPVYDPFALAAERNGIEVITNPLIVRENRYYIDFDLLETQLREQRPDVYLFCSPHNPAGRIWTREEMQQVYDLCQQYGVLLVVDEVHSEHILFGEHTSIGALNDEVKNNVILLTSPNKGFNFGGLKTSYAIIWNADIRRRFQTHLAKNSITSPNPFGIAALIAAYNESEQWLDAVTDYLRDNYLLTKQMIARDFPTWQLMEMDASYLCWIDVSQGDMSASELVPFLAEKAGVILEDGTHYVANGENYIRINIATSRELLLQAFERMKEVL
ncbi:MAG: PatB family C-S lyase [Aerococcaceae bacterium]|nr:PatB family C-S lyase [Aerococcaceae bacterium]